APSFASAPAGGAGAKYSSASAVIFARSASENVSREGCNGTALPCARGAGASGMPSFTQSSSVNALGLLLRAEHHADHRPPPRACARLGRSSWIDLWIRSPALSAPLRDQSCPSAMTELPVWRSSRAALSTTLARDVSSPWVA